MAILCYMRYVKDDRGKELSSLFLIRLRSSVHFIVLGGLWSFISLCFYAYWSYSWGEYIRCGLLCERKKRNEKRKKWLQEEQLKAQEQLIVKLENEKLEDDLTYKS